MRREIAESLEKNRHEMEERLQLTKNFDLVERKLKVGDRDACLYFVDGFVKDEVLEKLMEFFQSLKPELLLENDEAFSGWPRRYLCAGCTAQYHADGRAPLKEACRRPDGTDRAALHKGKPGEKIQKYPSSDGGIIIGENHEQEMCEMRASASGGRFFLSTLHGNSSGKRGDQGAEAVEKEGFCDWSSTGVSGRCGLCFFFVP